MTRKEAISYLSQIYATTYSKQYRDALSVVLSLLRPVSREQVKKVWRGCPVCNDYRCASCRCFGWHPEVCGQCENQSNYQPLKFCPHCGKPLGDEGVDMVMERLEELKNGKAD